MGRMSLMGAINWPCHQAKYISRLRINSEGWYFTAKAPKHKLRNKQIAASGLLRLLSSDSHPIMSKHSKFPFASVVLKFYCVVTVKFTKLLLPFTDSVLLPLLPLQLSGRAWHHLSSIRDLLLIEPKTHVTFSNLFLVHFLGITKIPTHQPPSWFIGHLFVQFGGQHISHQVIVKAKGYTESWDFIYFYNILLRE